MGFTVADSSYRNAGISLNVLGHARSLSYCKSCTEACPQRGQNSFVVVLHDTVISYDKQALA